MSKIRLFLYNFVVYGMGGVIIKIVPFIMLPIITRLLPDSCYLGVSESFNLIVSFGSAIALFGMYDAMFRLFFDSYDIEYKKKICSTALDTVLFSSLIVLICVALCRKELAIYVLRSPDLTNIIWISIFTILFETLSAVIGAPTRMLNNSKVFIWVNTLSPLVAYGCAIVLIVRGCYETALPIGALLAAALTLVLYYALNKRWFSLRLFDLESFKELLKVGAPIVPIFLIYWIFSSCDRLMISNLIGMSATGVYSVAAKFGHVSQLLYTAFAGGWQYFSFTTMKENNQVEMNSRIFECLGMLSFLIGCFMCCLSKLLISVLFTEEYSEAFLSIPYLFMAPLLLMLFQVNSNQFLVIKKTWPSVLILLVGALINIYANYRLIPIYGIEGAAIGTLIGYFAINAICCVVLLCMHLFIMRPRFIVTLGIYILFFALWRIWIYKHFFFSIGCTLAIGGVYYYLYRKEIYEVVLDMKRGVQ